MKALILAGGFGTRLRPLTETVPKPLLPIANKPLLEHQIRLLATHGVEEATLLTGYLAEDFHAFAEQMKGYGVTVSVSTEDHPLGTAGAVGSQRHVMDGPTLVFNGDVLTSLDLTALIQRHEQTKAAVTLALTWVDDSDAFGVVPADDDGRITAFLQNPKTGTPQPGAWINAGTYVLEPRVFEGVPDDTMWSFEDQLFPSLLQAGERLTGYPSDSYWIDIGNHQRFMQVHRDIMSGAVDALFDGRMVGVRERVGHGEVIGPCIVSQPLLLGPQARVGPMVCMGAGVLVGAGAQIEDSVLIGGARVGVGATVRGSILGSRARIPVGAEVIEQIVD